MAPLIVESVGCPRQLPPTRFATLSPLPAATIIIALCCLVLLGFLRGQPPMNATPHAAMSVKGDLDLYRSIADRVGAGESYYAAAVAEHRASNFPLRPFMTVRLPTLAAIRGHLGPLATVLLLNALALVAWVMFRARVRACLPERAAFAASGALLLGLLVCVVPAASSFHETWAATLIVLSLASRSRDRWGLAVVFGLAACSVRELALPYLGVMLVGSLVDGSRREAAAWMAAITVVLMLLAAHALAVASVTTPQDLASPGWAAFGGWPFILTILRYSPLLAPAPAWIVAIVVPLALLGWIGWRDPLGFRGAFILCGYSVAFMLIGRPNNDYWGLLLAPLLLVGLVFAPGALCDLARALRVAPRLVGVVR